MKTRNKLALCALILPAVTFSVGAVAADDNSQRGMQGSNERSDRMPASQQHSKYMSAIPEGAVRVDDVLSSSLHLHGNDDDVGSINDLIIDESGQVIAVIVDVGGFLGIGQRSVAVSWDSVERSLNEEGDGYRFSVNATEDALRDAPAYDKNSKGMRTNYSQ